MKLKTLIPLVGNCYVTIWKRDGKDKMRVIARGYSRNENNFEKYQNKNVIAIRPTWNSALSITVE